MFHFFGYRSFEPEYATMKKMRQLGITTFTFMVSNNANFMGMPYTRYQPTWIWEHEFDFTQFDRNVNDLLTAVPDAQLICYVDLNPPPWWLRRGKGGDRFDPFEEFGRVAALPEYREDEVEYMQALLRHAIQSFPHIIKAFILNGGKTTEWFDCSRGIESAARLTAFQKYMEKQGKEIPSDIPPFNIRYAGVPESGNLIRTPEKNGLALDYWRFNSELSAETVALFLQKAREILPAEIGLSLCYGYVFDLTSRYCQASWGQLEYERVFSMPAVNFITEPISYQGRGMGGSPISMVPQQSLKTLGKNLMISVDSTTFTSRFPKPPGKSGGSTIMGRKVEWKTPQEIIAGLKREMSYNLINGNSTWHFDMWGGWWDSSAAQNTLLACRKIWDAEAVKPSRDTAEVVLVADPQNMYYINDAHPQSMMFTNAPRKALADAGFPYTTASFNDLPSMHAAPLKLIICCHPFALDGGKIQTLKAVAKGKTVLFLYGPGVIHQGKWAPDHVREICGTDFGTPGISTVTMPDYQAVYVADPNCLTREKLQAVAQAAGVHRWTSGPAPVYANDHLVAVHIGQEGQMKLAFPFICRKITELFSGDTFENTDQISISVNEPDTKLFSYQK